MIASDERKNGQNRISVVELRIEEISRSQSFVLEGVRSMHTDLKSSLNNFVMVMKVLTVALIVELGIQGMLMSLLILKESPKELRASREGFSITGPGSEKQ